MKNKIIIGAVLLSAVSSSKITSVRTVSRPTVRVSTFKSTPTKVTVKTSSFKPTSTKTTTTVKPKIVSVKHVPGKIVNAGTTKKTTVINNVTNKTTVVNNSRSTYSNDRPYDSTRIIERDRGLGFWDYMMLKSVFGGHDRQPQTVVVTQPVATQQLQGAHVEQPVQYVEQPTQRQNYTERRSEDGLPWVKILSWMLGLGAIGGLIWIWRKEQ